MEPPCVGFPAEPRFENPLIGLSGALMSDFGRAFRSPRSSTCGCSTPDTPAFCQLVTRCVTNWRYRAFPRLATQRVTPTITRPSAWYFARPVVQYVLDDKSPQIFASRYQFQLPSEETLKNELEREMKALQDAGGPPA